MKIFTVNEIQDILRNLILNEFQYPITVKGEVANIRVPTSGHQYFSLREDNASINCVLFNGQSKQNVRDFESQEVLITGNVDLYKGNGNCQIKVIELTEYGEGALKKAIEKTRKKLEKEGLFENNRQLPEFPKSISIITSPDSHALRDVCSKLKERYPLTEVIIYPCLVQGKEASSSIIKQIKKCNSDALTDLIMIIRGGGSLEDLMPFNDELLARCIYESKLPVITGIGHQPDITIADYVADVSMETPTAAAVRISPDKFELIQKIDSTESHIKKYINFKMDGFKNHLLENKNKLKTCKPEVMISGMLVELKKTNNNIFKIISYKLREIKYLNKINKTRLKQTHTIIKQEYLSYFSKYKLFHNELIKMIRTYFAEKQSTIKAKTNELISFNPKKTLKKGYSIIRDSNEKIVKNKEIFKKLKKFNVEFYDGLVKSHKK